MPNNIKRFPPYRRSSVICIRCLWLNYIIIIALSEAKAMYIFTSTNYLFILKITCIDFFFSF